MDTTTQAFERNSVQTRWTPPRHPHTTILGLMGAALLLFTGWSFLRGVSFTANPHPGVAVHAGKVHVRG
jgi:hypothetical protein